MPDEAFFDETRRAILAAALDRAAFNGFTPIVLKESAAWADASQSDIEAAFPAGVRDLLAFWSLEADRAVEAFMASDAVADLRIREKVARAIEIRIEYLSPHREAARRAAAFLALPTNAPLGARLTWGAADAIWRSLGDQSTDFNFYSKRAILSGVWTSSLAKWFTDDDPDWAETKAFIAARIENVMQFEKVKKRVNDAGVNPADIIATLARFRYR